MGYQTNLENELLVLRKEAAKKWTDALQLPIKDDKGYYFMAGYAMGIKYAVEQLIQKFRLWGVWSRDND